MINEFFANLDREEKECESIYQRVIEQMDPNNPMDNFDANCRKWVEKVDAIVVSNRNSEWGEGVEKRKTMDPKRMIRDISYQRSDHLQLILVEVLLSVGHQVQ